MFGCSKILQTGEAMNFSVLRARRKGVSRSEEGTSLQYPPVSLAVRTAMYAVDSSMLSTSWTRDEKKM